VIQILVDDRQVQAALRDLQARLSNMTPAMRAIATELEARAGERFESESDPAGEKWAQLSDATLLGVMRRAGRGNARKQRGGTKAVAIRALASRRILYDQGDLLGSLTSRAGRDFAEVGFGQRYAAYHEWGTERMPRRGLLFADPHARLLGEVDRTSILDILSEHIGGR
jgi:phage virion morphogenesis protein